MNQKFEILNRFKKSVQYFFDLTAYISNLIGNSIDFINIAVNIEQETAL